MNHQVSSPGLVRDASGYYSPARSILSEADILAAAEDIAQRRFTRAGQLASVADTRQFLRAKLLTRDREIFAVVFMDQRHRVIAFEELFFGSIDGASVHVREVIKRALHHNAAAVLLSHNHPSGVAEPSQADEQITVRLRDALALVDVRVIDHIVVGFDDMVSFAERGLL